MWFAKRLCNGHREAGGLRIEAGGAERLPERGEVFDPVNSPYGLSFRPDLKQ